MAIGDIVDPYSNKVITPAQPPAGGDGGAGAPGAGGSIGDTIDPYSGKVIKSAQPPPAGGADDDLGQGKAAQYGLVSGVPFGKDIGAAVETGESYLPRWMVPPGDAPVDQTGESLSQRFAENRARILKTAQKLKEAHPYTTTVASLLPMIGLPGGATMKGAMLYGGGFGAESGIDEGDSLAGTAVKTAMGTAGGALGSKLASALPVAGDATRKAVLDAADRLGVTMPRYSVSTSPLIQRAGMIGQSVPGMSAPLEHATQESTEKMGEAAAAAAGPATAYSAGKEAKAAIGDYVGPTSQDIIDQRYNYASSLMNKNVTTPLTNTAAALTKLAQVRGTYNDQLTGAAVDKIQQAMQMRRGLSYDGIKNLRTQIGSMGSFGSLLPNELPKSEISQLYGALSQDLDAAASRSGGPNALQAHKLANDTYSSIAAQRQQLVDLLGGESGGANPESVFSALQRSASGKPGSADLDALRLAKQAILQSKNPGAWNELSQGMVSELGRDADGNFSPQRFLTGYGNIGDDAKNELFAPNSLLRNNLDDLATVSRQWKSLYKYANPSGTAGHGAGIGMAIEGWRHPLKTLAAYLVGGSMGKFLATPAGSGAAANWVRAVGSGNLNMIRDAAQRVSASAGAQLGAKIDPMAMAAAAMHREEEGHGGGDSGGGNVPQ